VASNSIDEEPSTIPINSNINFPSPSSSSSSSSSIHFTLANETEKLSSPINIPFPPPMPPNLTQKPAKLVKPDSQSSINSSSSNVLPLSTIKASSPATTNTINQTTISGIKRPPSKTTSVFSKISNKFF